MKALVNCDIYTGTSVLTDHAVMIDGKDIVDVVSRENLPPDVGRVDLGGRTVSPGFIDIQVNGGGDQLFNEAPTLESLVRIRDGHRRLGTTDILPTYITGGTEGMRQAAAAVRQFVDKGLDGVLGIHFEGPAISSERAGVHDRSFVRAESAEDLVNVYATDVGGVRLVTLAPESVAPGFVAKLVSTGAIVSIGHSNADKEAIERAFSEGASGATHVWNAMSPMTSRDPGVVGRVLRNDRIACSVIVDGYHVDLTTVAVTIAAKPKGKCFLVTDAMAPVGGYLTEYRIGPHEISVLNGRPQTADGVLAGSVLDMATAVRNCVQRIGVPKDEALRMATLYPARFIGVDDRFGRIERGYIAHLVVLSNEIDIAGVILSESDLEPLEMELTGRRS